jgi:beta,beta-carotene 9',10'-dioxygenase
MTATPFQNFISLDHEATANSLPVTGAIPEWLKGTLVRNGPAKFDLANSPLRHWFDGLAMLHRFSFANGQVSYASRFLQSKAYQTAVQTGQPGFREFGTDPCQTLFGSIKGLYSPDFSDNASVNVGSISGQFMALSETPLPVLFDPITLETIGNLAYQDQLAPRLAYTTAHPHYDFEHQALFNFGTQISGACRYNIYFVEDGSLSRELLCSIPVREPAYMHTFALTPNFIILVEFPLILKDPLQMGLGFKPFAENFEWRPEKGTVIRVISKSSGEEIQRYSAPAFFAFHHINAFEKSGEIFLDLAAYQDARIIESLYLDNLNQAQPGTASNLPFSQLIRLRLNPFKLSATFEVVLDQHLELPRINYGGNSGQPYRYAYTVGRPREGQVLFEDRLLKVDLQTLNLKTWVEPGCFPGEPVFVPSPQSQTEDAGVVLSVVLDTRHNNSFLLILDAVTFEERARATTPNLIPFGLHGAYFETVSAAG